MQTPAKVTNWFTGYYADTLTNLYALPVPAQDPLAGLVGDANANFPQHLADFKAGLLAHPPTGNEPDPAAYQKWYDDALLCVEYLRRMIGYTAGH